MTGVLDLTFSVVAISVLSLLCQKLQGLQSHVYINWQSNNIQCQAQTDLRYVIFQQVKQRDDALAESGELQRFVIDLDNFQIWLVFPDMVITFIVHIYTPSRVLKLRSSLCFQTPTQYEQLYLTDR